MFKRLVSGLAVIAMLLSGLTFQPIAVRAAIGEIPVEPSDLAVSNLAATGLTLSWKDNSKDETDFIIRISTDGNDFSNVLATVPTNDGLNSGITQSYNVTNLIPNTPYWFRINAVSANGESNPLNGSRVLTKAAAPGNVAYGVITNVAIPLSWDANGNPADTVYAVTWNDITAQVGSSVDAQGVVGFNSIVYKTKAEWDATNLVTGLTPGHVYNFRVISYDRDSNLGDYIDSPGVATIGPKKPTDLDLSITPTTMALSWFADPSGNQTNYILGISSDGGSTFATSSVKADGSDDRTAPCTDEGNNPIANCLYHTFTGLSVNSPYVFSVTAANEIGEVSDTVTTSENFTFAKEPLAPVVKNITKNSLNVSIAPNDGNPAHTMYVIRVTKEGVGKGIFVYVQLDGTLGDTPVYRTAVDWGTTTVTGLLKETTYTVTAWAKSGSDIQTDTSGGTVVKTLGDEVIAPPVVSRGGGGGGGFLIPSNNTVATTRTVLVTNPETLTPVVVTTTTTQPIGQVLGEKIGANATLDELIAKTKYGQTSNDVKLLQNALRKAGFFPRWVRSTGWYGPITRAAVAKYQASK